MEIMGLLRAAHTSHSLVLPLLTQLYSRSVSPILLRELRSVAVSTFLPPDVRLKGLAQKACLSRLLDYTGVFPASSEQVRDVKSGPRLVLSLTWCI